MSINDPIEVKYYNEKWGWYLRQGNEALYEGEVWLTFDTQEEAWAYLNEKELLESNSVTAVLEVDDG